MQEQGFFFQALVYLTAAVVSVPLAKRLGLGSVLGYLLGGIIIGPFVLGLIGEEGQDVMHFAEFGVVMMLFLVGLELKPSLLWQMRRSIFGLGGLQMLISTIALAAIALLFKQSISQALSIGMILALSSTAIILQTLNEKGQMKTKVGKSAFSVLLFQDISVIPILAILPLLATSAGTHIDASHAKAVHTVAGLEMTGWVQFAMVLIVIFGIGFSGRYLARYIFRAIAKTGLREIFTATALLLVIAISLAMEWVGLSPALGAFIGGVVLADNEYRHEIEANIEPFKGLLLGLFFIAVGVSIDFNLLIERPLSILMFLGILIIVKLIVLLFLGRQFGLRRGKGTLFAFALAQGGEFAFVLISFSLQNNILTKETSGILLLVVALSMAITPLLLLINEKIILPAIEKNENEREPDLIEETDNPVIIAGFGRFGIGVNRLLMANGIKATVLDDNPDNIDVLKKFGFKVYYGDPTRLDLLKAAGCENAKLIIIAIDDIEKALQLTDQIQRIFPHLKIFERAVSKKHGYELIKRNITHYEHDMLNSSIELGTQVLSELGFSNYQALRAGRIFKHHNRETEQELFEIYEKDEQHYISETYRFTEELETLLAAENNNTYNELDTHWDISTRLSEASKKTKQNPS